MVGKRAYNLSIKKLAEGIGTSLTKGLTYQQVNNKLDTIGLNKLPDKQKSSVLALLFEQFQDFMVLVLIAAVIISGFLGEFADAIAILAIVILNAAMGFIQEFRAEKSLQALKELSAPKAKVLREGNIEEVSSQQLVPGDIILVETGDKVPADARIIESNNLTANEASLTGESIPVTKEEQVLQGDLAIGDRSNMIYMGTNITQGRGKAIVTATGLPIATL